jgi:hypothetical protein
MKMKLQVESLEDRDVPAPLPPIAGLQPHESPAVAVAQTQAEAEARANTIRNIINQNTTWTPAQRNAVSDAVIQLVDAANKLPHAWIFPPEALGACDQWQASFMQTNMLLINTLERAGLVRVDTVAWASTGTIGSFFGAAHMAVRITLPDGTVFYVDDGNWGGGDHLFIQSEVPVHFVPHAISTDPRTPWVLK